MSPIHNCRRLTVHLPARQFGTKRWDSRNELHLDRLKRVCVGDNNVDLVISSLVWRVRLSSDQHSGVVTRRSGLTGPGKAPMRWNGFSSTTAVSCKPSRPSTHARWRSGTSCRRDTLQRLVSTDRTWPKRGEDSGAVQSQDAPLISFWTRRSLASDILRVLCSE